MADEVGEVRDEKLDAEAEARRRGAPAQIRQYPDPALRMKAHDGERFAADLERLVEQLRLLLVDADGLGLAATQVGVLRRLFVLRPAPGGAPPVLLMPRLFDGAADRLPRHEVCLSLKVVFIPVERHGRVAPEAQGPEGKDVRLE